MEKATVLLLFLLAPCFIAWGVPDDPKASPDPIVIEKLEEILKIREREWKTVQLQVEMGHDGNASRAEVAVAEARIALASERGDIKSIIAELRRVVKIHETHWARAKALVDEDRLLSEDLGRLRVSQLEAEVRLQRAITGRPKK